MLALYEGAVDDRRSARRRRQARSCSEHGDGVRVTAESDARFLLIAGKPLNEPVAWCGPFVMNTREEVAQAFDDYAPAGSSRASPPRALDPPP